MRKAALVRLTDEQRTELTRRLEPQALHGRPRRRHQLPLLADQGRTDAPMAQATGAGRSTGERVRPRLARQGLEAALTQRKRCGAPAQWDGQQEALLSALACSNAPEGQAQGTARLRAPRAAEMEGVESISEATVRRLLKKMRSSRGRSARGASRR